MATLEKFTTEKIKIEMPTVVGVVDLKKLEKKKKDEAPAAKFIMYQNFPLANYDAILELVKAANKHIGKDAVTISKVAKIKQKKVGGGFEFVEAPGHGSIWYSCNSSDFKKWFRIPYDLFGLSKMWGIRKVTKREITELAYGLNFYALYLRNDLSVATEVIKNVKIHNGKKNESVGIWYEGAKDVSQTAYVINFTDINDDGTFDTGVEGETGYLYADVKIEQ
jgi:hypothetical protein